MSIKDYWIIRKKMFDMTFPTPESVNKYRDTDDKY